MRKRINYTPTYRAVMDEIVAEIHKATALAQEGRIEESEVMMAALMPRIVQEMGDEADRQGMGQLGSKLRRVATEMREDQERVRTWLPILLRAFAFEGDGGEAIEEANS